MKKMLFALALVTVVAVPAVIADTEEVREETTETRAAGDVTPAPVEAPVEERAAE